MLDVLSLSKSKLKLPTISFPLITNVENSFLFLSSQEVRINSFEVKRKIHITFSSIFNGQLVFLKIQTADPSIGRLFWTWLIALKPQNWICPLGENGHIFLVYLPDFIYRKGAAAACWAGHLSTNNSILFTIRHRPWFTKSPHSMVFF